VASRFSIDRPVLAAFLAIGLLIVGGVFVLALVMLPRAAREAAERRDARMNGSPEFSVFVQLTSPDGRYDQTYLGNYAAIEIKDRLERTAGVFEVVVIGRQEQSLRLRLDAARLKQFNLTSKKVVDALREQNVQIIAEPAEPSDHGEQPPAAAKQDISYIMTTPHRVASLEDLSDTIIEPGSSGELARVRDVARIELAYKSPERVFMLADKPAVGLAVYDRPGANAGTTYLNVRAAMEELKREFPPGVDFSIVIDTTELVEVSLRNKSASPPSAAPRAATSPETSPAQK